MGQLRRLWDYFEQEVRKLKVSRGNEEQNLEATPLSPLQLGLVFIPPKGTSEQGQRWNTTRKVVPRILYAKKRVLKQFTGA